MSARQQIFYGSVRTAAARDVHIHAPHERTESELQADFIRITGIKDSSPEARAHLDWLMRDHGFNLAELRRAYRANSLRWCQEAREWRGQHRRLDLVWGWSGLAMLAAFLLYALASLVLRMPAGTVFLATATGCVALCAMLGYLLAITSLIPQRTAARVAVVYSQSPPPQQP